MIPPNVGQIPPELDLFAIIFGVFVTIFIYSFLVKENPLSRAVEHLFVGMAAVFTLAAMYDAAMTQAIWGTERIAEGYYIWVIPILLSLMYFFFFTKKYFYLYRYPVAIVAGIMAGMVITGLIQSNFVAQIRDTAALPLVGAAATAGTPPEWFNSLIVIIGSITALTFFFFTWEHRGPLGISVRIGRYVLMATFGTAYGGTVMARMSLFIGRLTFLIEEGYPEPPWFWAWYLVPVAVILVLIVLLWQRARPSPTTPVPSTKPTEEKKTKE